MNPPRVRFWGVRGSFPASRPGCRLLGGNTPCVQVEWGGHHLVIDAGTGVRKLGEQLPPGSRVDLMISHAHWDHIQGFPFFRPAYDPQAQLRVHSLERPVPIESLLRDQQEATYFPVPLEDMQSHLSFHQWSDGEEVEAGPFRVRLQRLNHPGVCSGFRVQAGDLSLAYVCDVAPSRDHLMAEWAGAPPREAALKLLYENQLRLADGADVMIYDTFFTPEQYRERSHWGHSTLEDGLEVQQQSLAGELVMFHHNAEMDDEMQLARAAGHSGVRVAAENQWFELARRGLRACS